MKKIFQRICLQRAYLAPALLLCLLSAPNLAAQQTQPPSDAPSGQPDTERPVRPMDFVRDLGLTPEQIQRIRFTNQETKEAWQRANLRLSDAQLALDDAIYSDTVDETAIETRARELAQAQSELIRVRSMRELKIRRILNPEQLARLREMRKQVQLRQRQFMEQNQIMRPPPMRPVERRMNRQLQGLPPQAPGPLRRQALPPQTAPASAPTQAPRKQP